MMHLHVLSSYSAKIRPHFSHQQSSVENRSTVSIKFTQPITPNTILALVWCFESYVLLMVALFLKVFLFVIMICWKAKT